MGLRHQTATNTMTLLNSSLIHSLNEDDAYKYNALLCHSVFLVHFYSLSKKISKRSRSRCFRVIFRLTFFAYFCGNLYY